MKIITLPPIQCLQDAEHKQAHVSALIKTSRQGLQCTRRLHASHLCQTSCRRRKVAECAQGNVRKAIQARW